MEKTQAFDVLRLSDFFGDLSDASLADIVGRGRVRKIKRTEMLFSMGDEGDAVYAVLSGRVLLSRVTEEGKEIALAAMEEGSVFGELSLIDGEPRSTDANVVEAGEVFVLQRSAFKDAMSSDPAIANIILVQLCQRLRATNRLVESVSFLELGPRLARLLLLLALNGKRLANGHILLGSKYTQAELGKRIAASRESVSKQLAQWTRDNVVGIQEGCLVLKDLESINSWAEDIDLEL